LFSVFGLTLEANDISNPTWNLTARAKVTWITLALLLLVYLPVLIPWLYRMSPQLERFFDRVRGQGVKTIEFQASIFGIRVDYGVENAADAYENTVLKPIDESLTPEDIEQQLRESYAEALELTDSSLGIDPTQALQRIDDLASYYGQIRQSLPSGRRRTSLFTQIASTMWSLMPSTQDFPIHNRLNSPEGGDRLSAYKYLEWRPSAEFTDNLLSRAVGVLETPFGQYHALLALRSLVTKTQLTQSQKQRISHTLARFEGLEYLGGTDRRTFMLSILAVLRSSNSSSTEDTALQP
jgi:hypothetical protein